MTKPKNQNPIYIATTISVYLGLVLIGASPQILAQSGVASESQTRILELTSKTSSVLSKLKHGKEKRIDDLKVVSNAGTGQTSNLRTSYSVDLEASKARVPEIRYSNEKILTRSMLPRASL